MNTYCEDSHKSTQKIQNVINAMDDFELEDYISEEVKKLPKEWNMTEDLANIESHLESVKSDVKLWSTIVSTK